MLELPNPKDYKIDPGWGIKPGQYIHHVPDKKRIGKVKEYHNATSFVFLANSNELLTVMHGLLVNQSKILARQDESLATINEDLQRVTAIVEGWTKAHTEHPTDAEDYAPNVANRDKIRKGAQNNPNQANEQVNMFSTEPKEGIVVTIKTESTPSIQKSTPPYSTIQPTQSTESKVCDSAVSILTPKIKDLLQTIASGRAEDKSKNASTIKHPTKSLPNKHSRHKTLRTQPCKLKSYTQPHSATAKSSASSRTPPVSPPNSALRTSSNSSIPSKKAAMSAPVNEPMAPFKRRFIAAVPGSQASSEASFKSAPEFLAGENGTTSDPVSTGEGSGPTQPVAGQQPVAADPYAGIGEFFENRPSIASPAALPRANDGQGSSANKLAKKGGESVVAAGLPVAKWVPPRLRGVLMPAPRVAAPTPAPAPAPAAKKEAKKAVDWRDVVDERIVANSHTNVEVPEVKERHMLHDVYRTGLHDDNSEAKKDIKWW
ncbi:MAG: hypothetical protein Q9212_006104 [Teloschistes hypoglaucus]